MHEALRLHPDDEQFSLDAAESTEAAIAVDRSLLDLRIGGAWLREDLPVEYAIGFDAAAARPI